jgi:hypothetical protein
MGAMGKGMKLFVFDADDVNSCKKAAFLSLWQVTLTLGTRLFPDVLSESQSVLGRAARSDLEMSAYGPQRTSRWRPGMSAFRSLAAALGRWSSKQFMTHLGHGQLFNELCPKSHPARFQSPNLDHCDFYS